MNKLFFLYFLYLFSIFLGSKYNLSFIIFSILDALYYKLIYI